MKRLLPLVLLLTLPGCALLSSLLSSAFKQPTFDFKGLKLRDATLGGIGVDTQWRVGNPNSVGISLAEADYRLSIEGHPVLAGKPPNGLNIPAMGGSDLVFPADVRFQDLAPTVQVFLQKDVAQYQVDGHVGLNTPIGVLKLPFSKTGTFEVPKVPQVQLGNPKVTGLNFQGATVSFPLTLTSKNSYPLPVANVSGTLFVEGVSVGRVSTGNLGVLQPRATQTVQLPVTLNFINVGTAVMNAVNGGRARVRFDAQVQSGVQAMPLKLDQALQFVR